MTDVEVTKVGVEKEIGALDNYLEAHDTASYITTEPTTSQVSLQHQGQKEEEEEHHRILPEHYEWHLNKGSQYGGKEPIDLDKGHKEEPGCGLDPETFCGKCAIFWGEWCSCQSGEKTIIGIRRVGARIGMAFLFWGFFWSITALGGRYALPGGSLFGIIMVFLWGLVGERLIIMIPMPFDLPTLPPLLASLFIGIILRNVPHIKVAKYIDPDWSFTLRQMALGVILGEAGVEVDKEMMRKLKTVVPRLSFSPCITEAMMWGIFAHLIMSLPWMWSFMLGFVCGAVAPACVVPSMIRFQGLGLGVAHGVPTLLMAAASIDDIIAINCFNILATIKFSTGVGIGYDILTACFEVVFGILFGIVGGILMWIFPDPRQHNIIRDRTVILMGMSWFLIFMSNILDISGAGTLGTLTCSFIASIGWPEHQQEMVGHYYKSFWFLMQPLLFGLTGANVNLSLMSGHTVGLTVATMVICLAIRMAVAGNAVSFLGWTHKEKFLTAITWIPKATVQAAIGGTALDWTHQYCDPWEGNWPPVCNSTDTGDTGSMNYTITTVATTPTAMPITSTNENSTNAPGPVQCINNKTFPSPLTCERYFNYSTIILQVSVIVIIFTAPIGVFLIGLAGPRLLTVGEPPNDDGDNKSHASNDSVDLEMGDLDKKAVYENDKVFESDDEHVKVDSPPPVYETVANTKM